MVAEVNKIIAGELLSHRSVTIAGVGTFYVAHRNARRLSRRQIAAPRSDVEFRPSEDGVALAELIRRAAGCDAAQAQAIFERWLSKTREGEMLTLEGIGILRHRAFATDPAFAALLNPAGDDVVTLQPRMNRFVVAIAAAAVAVAVGIFGYIEFGPKSVTRLVARSERPQPQRTETVRGSEPAVEGAAAAAANEQAAVRSESESRDARPESEESGAAVSVPNETADAAERSGVEHAASESVETSAAPVASGSSDRSTVAPETERARQSFAEGHPAAERLQSGWCYAVFGVFSTEENAVRCREQLLRDMPSLTVGVYPFGSKYMVAPFAAQDRGACERFVREHRPTWPDLWIYAKK